MPRERDGLPAMRRVESSSIRAVGYDSEHARLVIDFAGGGRYVYYGVPPSAYRELLAAESIGRHVNSVIKPRYPSESLNS
ncbi:KTSC domain-containing protein [Microlunatus parietis]|uniref:KTSC domain-containing protein n=1 Tax=Microlunatus parietis TaxID=682979 RepID=A0A7Y9I8S0_9ACTN|nr:KTSC domain-containing protein [Microlunatus parietis]NYE72335.1 hypothetical protein [Microlunatus parietis]